MIRGTITQFNPRRGTGFVRHPRGEQAIPFSVRHAQDAELTHGDVVEFVVRGGMAGPAARNLRRIRATS